MSLNFIPTVWAARLLSALEKSLVYGQAGVVNRDYEGEINQSGDTVKIGSIGDPTIGTYTKDTDITIQALTDAEQTLLINQQKYFGFAVDDIDKIQQNVTGNSYDIQVRMDDGRVIVVNQKELGGVRENTYVRVVNGRVVLR